MSKELTTGEMIDIIRKDEYTKSFDVEYNSAFTKVTYESYDREESERFILRMRDHDKCIQYAYWLYKRIPTKSNELTMDNLPEPTYRRPAAEVKEDD